MTPQGWGRAGWAAAAVLAVFAAGGAARTLDGIQIGLPGWPAVVAIVAVTAVLARRQPSWGLPALGLAIVPLAWIAAPTSLAAGALSGPPVLALVVAALLLVVPDPLRLRRFFVPVLVILYSGAALLAQRDVGPQGDEPHYLMVADSLLRDGDVRLDEDYREGRYAAFFHDGPLEPHFRVRGRNGEIFSLHALGLSVLVLPAYAIGGYAAASLFMALLGVMTAVVIRGLAREAAGEATGETAGWLVALSPPLLSYAGLVFTEVPAALLAAWGLREGLRAREIRPCRALVTGAGLAFLPWLNVRYVIVAAIVGLFWLAARPRLAVLATLVAPALASGAAIAAYHHTLYGFIDPRRVYGKSPEFALETLLEGVPGLLLDQEFGLLVYAPIFVLAIPGLFVLIRRSPRLGLAAAGLVLAVGLTAGSWHMWRGGFNPPARFLVPIVPALALGVAAWMQDRRWIGAALLAGWGVWAGLAGASDPSLLHRDRDVTAPFYRAHSGAVEWTRLLPSYVLAERDRHRLAAVWAVVLAMAAVRRGRGGPVPVAVGIVILGGAAEIAGRLSDGRAGGREATHLLGRLAFEWPRGGFGRVSDVAWKTTELGWGPVYEPHRHSARVLAADRLRLPPGPHRLLLVAEPIGGGLGAPPAIEVIGPHGRRLGPLTCRPEGCDLPVPSPREITLRLEGGSPFALKEIRLFNLSGPPGSNLTEGRGGSEP